MSQADAVAEAIRKHLVGFPVAVRICGQWTGGKHLDRWDRLDDATVIGNAVLLEFADDMHLVLREPRAVSFENNADGAISMLRIGSVRSAAWTWYREREAHSAATLHQLDYVVLGDDIEVTHRSAGRAITKRHRGPRGVDFSV